MLTRRTVVSTLRRGLPVSMGAAAFTRQFPYPLQSFRYCSSTGLTPQSELKHEAFDEASLPREEGTQSFRVSERLSARTDISEEDKQMIREAVVGDPANQPAHKNRMGGVGAGPEGAEMVAAFTCDECSTRSVKKFKKHCYDKGIVIVQCPGCGVKHLIADHMGWFMDDGKTIEDILREKGEKAIRINGIHIDW